MPLDLFAAFQHTIFLIDTLLHESFCSKCILVVYLNSRIYVLKGLVHQNITNSGLFILLVHFLFHDFNATQFQIASAACV